jgi:hypothetical protein
MRQSAIAVISAAVIDCPSPRGLAAADQEVSITELGDDAVGAGASRWAAGLQLPSGWRPGLGRCRPTAMSTNRTLQPAYPQLPIRQPGVTSAAPTPDRRSHR